eukprot:7550427-Pyramimonas_sp.AAC.2
MVYSGMYIWCDIEAGEAWGMPCLHDACEASLLVVCGSPEVHGARHIGRAVPVDQANWLVKRCVCRGHRRECFGITADGMDTKAQTNGTHNSRRFGCLIACLHSSHEADDRGRGSEKAVILRRESECLFVCACCVVAAPVLASRVEQIDLVRRDGFGTLVRRLVVDDGSVGTAGGDGLEGRGHKPGLATPEFL